MHIIVQSLHHNVNFRMQRDVELVDHTIAYLHSKIPYLTSFSAAVIHQYKGLIRMNANVFEALTFPSTLLDEPSGRNFNQSLRRRIRWNGGILFLQQLKCFGGNRWILEE